MRGQKSSGLSDEEISRLADAQHGVVARRQLLASGVGRRAIEERLHRGWLIPLHRGVYAVGHRHLRQEGRWMAAVLAAGPGAVLSHRDAAALHELRPTTSSRICVTAPGQARPSAGIWVHRRHAIAAADVTVVEAIPVTTVARTLVDLAPMLTGAQLASTLGEADRRGVLDPSAVEEALARARGRHGQGHRRMRAALDTHRTTGAQLTRSALEERFIDLITRAGVPRPHLNAPVAGVEVDALWPEHGVVVELDGWAYHRERQAAARDREKTNRLQLRGYVVLRFMHGDLMRRPDAVVKTLRAALAAAQSRRMP